MTKNPSTLMQQRFNVDIAKPLLVILFPEFKETIDKFKITVGRKFTWVTIEAYKRAKYRDGICKPENVTEPSIKIEVGITNHSTSPIISGRISEEFVKNNTHCFCFHFWNFIFSYGEGREFTEQQVKEAVTFLKSKNIGLPSPEEFYEQYYS